MSKTCGYCGEEFAARKSIQQFCSRRCAALNRGAARTVVSFRYQRRIPDSVIRSAIEEINQGATWRATRAKYGLAQGTIESRAEQDGIPIRRGQRQRVLRQRICIPDDRAALGYMAAIIDGEGTVGLGKGNTGKAVGRVWVFNTCVPLMEWLGSWGGTVRERSQEHSIGKKPCYVWSVSSRADVIALLEAVRPYMRIKGHLADQVLAALKERADERARFDQVSRELKAS